MFPLARKEAQKSLIVGTNSQMENRLLKEERVWEWAMKI